MTVYIIWNPQKERALAVVQRAVQLLKGWGARPVLPPEMWRTPGLTGAVFLPEPAAFEQADVLLTVGGDGTILHAAKHALPYQKPILGINLGRLGFLATCEVEEMPAKLEALVKGRYQLDERMLLDACAGMQKEWRHMALNDVVLYKGDRLQTMEFAIYCDGRLVNRYRGDGVIVATPTGSTAYSLSAGGPILDARIQGMVVTPICAHSLHSPPMVFSANRKLNIQVCDAARGAVFVNSDGAEEYALAPGAEVEIRPAERTVQLVTFDVADQFAAIDKKLKGR